MDEAVKSRIIEDSQIKKFSCYGFLKNLAFFKPYLVVYLMTKGLDLFQIGLLYTVREAVVYVFEVPSGVIADYYGRKKELQLCFIFYIVSFIMFFFVDDFYLAALAMVFFGLGEAFRSGTHKAMILSYLDEKDLKSYKTFVYGRTRSFSLLGSALNSLIAIVIIVFSPSYNYIFAFSIFPYIADFILISTYPSYLNGNGGLKAEGKQSIKVNIFASLRDSKLRMIVLNQGVFQSVLKSIRDTIQPIILSIVLTYPFVGLLSLSKADLGKVVIGLTYFVIKLLSSYSSRNVYKINDKYNSRVLMNVSFVILAVSIILVSLGIYASNLYLIISVFIVMNIVGDSRKPIYIDVLDDAVDKKIRATIMSIESQITAIFVMVIAPVFGYVASYYGLFSAFLISGVFVLFISFITRIKNVWNGLF